MRVHRCVRLLVGSRVGGRSSFRTARGLPLLAGAYLAAVGPAFPPVLAKHFAAHGFTHSPARLRLCHTHSNAIGTAFFGSAGVVGIIDTGLSFGTQSTGNPSASCSDFTLALTSRCDVCSSAGRCARIAIRLAIATANRSIVHRAHLGAWCTRAGGVIAARVFESAVLGFSTVSFTASAHGRWRWLDHRLGLGDDRSRRLYNGFRFDTRKSNCGEQEKQSNGFHCGSIAICAAIRREACA